MNGKLIKLTTILVLEVFWDCACTGLKSSKFSDCSNLISPEFQQSGQLQNCITPKPWIILGRVNNLWKVRKVLYKFGIQTLTRFQTQQSQAYNFELLLVVKSGSTAVPKFLFWCYVGKLEDDHFLCCMYSFLFLFIIGYALKVGIEQVIILEPRQFWLDRIIDLSSSFGLQVPPFDGNSLICFSMSTCYLDKWTIINPWLLKPLPSLEIRIAIANYSWTSRAFRSQLNHSGGWNHALVLVLKTKLHVSSDWLMSSSKLQRCLKLCWFAQTHVHHSSE
jgi:hypothetical protein